MRKRVLVREVSVALVLAFSLASCAKPGPQIDIPMVSVPGGSFEYDGDSADIASVSPFRMSRCLVTGDQYKAVMGSDPSRFAEIGHPVEGVSWLDAIAFCNKLSRLRGLKPVYSFLVKGRRESAPADWARLTSTEIESGNQAQADPKANGYGLPTEMEYMWAAMGATADSIAGDTAGGVDSGGFVKGYAGSEELLRGARKDRRVRLDRGECRRGHSGGRPAQAERTRPI